MKVISVFFVIANAYFTNYVKEATVVLLRPLPPPLFLRLPFPVGNNMDNGQLDASLQNNCMEIYSDKMLI